MTWNIQFYDGVDEQILALPVKIEARFIRIMELMEEHGANLGSPHTKSLGHGLFEIRAKAKEGIARGIFCYLKGNNIIIVHAFIKKTQKTPGKELALARKRMKEVTL
ncbi:MAG: type II toxin-antitoxin system RelE/ParE family toxin [Thalassotalea sp.]|mgnify:CR=1 FL=1|nr:type II toxin-antitoxin system RelE/ParE family toxin [Thalassotalea sp.]MDG2392893.1 type II toxin-antitoxin system RelE/ParE family toxin [Thalassotalea sp.]